MAVAETFEQGYLLLLSNDIKCGSSEMRFYDCLMLRNVLTSGFLAEAGYIVRSMWPCSKPRVDIHHGILLTFCLKEIHADQQNPRCTIFGQA